jgi:hypothetical protein
LLSSFGEVLTVIVADKGRKCKRGLGLGGEKYTLTQSFSDGTGVVRFGFAK